MIPKWSVALLPLFCFLIRPWPCITRFGTYLVGFLISAPVSFVTATQYIYQSANLHDVTWGNRPMSKKAEAELSKKRDDYQAYRFVAIFWLFVFNGLHFWAFQYFVDREEPINGGSMAFLLWKNWATTYYMVLMSMLGVLRYLLQKCCCMRGKLPEKIHKWKKEGDEKVTQRLI